MYNDNEIIGKSRSDLQHHYKQTHIPTLSSATQDTITDLSAQTYQQQSKRCISSPLIVIIPMYIDEDATALLDILAQQDWSRTTIVYLNAYRYDDIGNSITTEERWKEKKQELYNLINSYNNTILLDHLYNNKEAIGTIIADLNDTVLITYPYTTEPIIIRCDADTRHLETDYLSNIQSLFNNNSHIEYSTAHVRYTQPHRDRFFWLAETLSELAGYRNHHTTQEVPTYWPSMSYRASARIKIKWTQRDISRMEDYVIARKVAQRYGSVESPDWSRWIRNDSIVFCNPRRQIQNILAWRYRHENTDDFNFVDQDSLDDSAFENHHTAVEKLLSHQTIDDSELYPIIEYINTFCLTRKDIRHEFQEFRNTTITWALSLYRISYDNAWIQFREEKTILP